MIQITAYLRDEQDLVRWKALANKSQFLHDALMVQDGLYKTPKIGVIKTPKDAEKAVSLIGKGIKKTCKHGKYPGLCKVQGCPNYS